MQREINNEVHLRQTGTPFEIIGKSSAIDKTASNFDSINKKVKKIGVYDADIVLYIPGTIALIFQGMLQKV